MIVLPKWYLWLFTLVSIVMAVDTILARFFDIGDTQDSISIGWWVMFVLLIFSILTGLTGSTEKDQGVEDTDQQGS
jgi:hypothetical protein